MSCRIRVRLIASLTPCVQVSIVTLGAGAPDRRRSLRDSPFGEPHRPQLVRLILGSYGEMPGLQLTAAQAARLFGLRDITCRVVLSDLVRDGKLRETDGKYCSP